MNLQERVDPRYTKEARELEREESKVIPGKNGKVCSRCHKPRLYKRFWNNANNKRDGKQDWCIPCSRDYGRNRTRRPTTSVSTPVWTETSESVTPGVKVAVNTVSVNGVDPDQFEASAGGDSEVENEIQTVPEAAPDASTGAEEMPTRDKMLRESAPHGADTVSESSITGTGTGTGLMVDDLTSVREQAPRDEASLSADATTAPIQQAKDEVGDTFSIGRLEQTNLKDWLHAHEMTSIFVIGGIALQFSQSHDHVLVKMAKRGFAPPPIPYTKDSHELIAYMVRWLTSTPQTDALTGVVYYG